MTERKFDFDFSKIALITVFLALVFVLTASFSLYAEVYRDLEGDEINISTLEEGEYLVEVRGNARFLADDMEVTGQEADFNTLEQLVEFRGDVTTTAPDLYVTSGNLLYFLDDDRAEFSDDAYVEFQDFTAYADLVEYFMADDYALLTGNVEGTRAGDDFSAEEVEIDLAAETVDLRGDARIRIYDQEDAEDDLQEDEE